MVPQAEIDALVQLDFVVIVPAYRLLPQVTVLDGALADGRDCLTWARGELPSILAKEGVPADGKRVVAMGHSAGGGIALWLVSSAASRWRNAAPRVTHSACPAQPDRRAEETQGSQSDPPAAILALYALQSFRHPFWTKGLARLASVPDIPQELRERALEGPAPLASEPLFVDGKPNLESPRAAWMLHALKTGGLIEGIMKGPHAKIRDDDWAEAEPSRGFSGDGVDLAFPPTCFVHGDADDFVPFEFSKTAHEKLSATGAQAGLFQVPGANHTFDDPLFQEYTKKGLNFLKKYA